MALRLSRLYLLLPSGSKLCGRRATNTFGHAQIWNYRNINTCSLSGVNCVERRRRRDVQSLSALPPACTWTAQPQTLISLRQGIRNYSEQPTSKAADTLGGVAPPPKAVSSTERIKIILREYGTVAFVFHISMSLCTLGTCYLLVSNGLDVDKVMAYFNFESSATKKGASTFAISYLLYKMLLPVRATITIASVPVIVRYLRVRGWMKGVAKAPTK